MVIAQSFLARTFGAYTLQLFDVPDNSNWVPALGVALLVAAFLINLSKNQIIEFVASFIGVLKLVGIVLFGAVGIWLADDIAADFTQSSPRASWDGFLAATALGILAFKGFTTITNSGSELTEPHKNVGRAILISIALCVVIYALVGFAVASNLPIDQIIETKNYSLAAAARPALGDLGLWFTVILAMAATAGGIIASIFAVSRMLAMLTQMRLVAHSHFGMPGSIQKHTLVYTVVLGIVLTVFFDLTRIAALGIIFYLIMDIAVHWGILRYLRKEIGANAAILISAILLDLAVLGGFIRVKMETDMTVLVVALGAMAAIVISEMIFLKRRKATGS
jgi:amino acid transporter